LTRALGKRHITSRPTLSQPSVVSKAESCLKGTAPAAQLLPALGAYASTEAGKRTPGDDALVRQLHVAAGALNMALMKVPRMVPPMPPMSPPPPNVGSLS
jgi:hypothetical protein